MLVSNYNSAKKFSFPWKLENLESKKCSKATTRVNGPSTFSNVLLKKRLPNRQKREDLRDRKPRDSWDYTLSNSVLDLYGF